ncbi:MAG: hypothetical protein NTX12_08565 [Actinobacteria bacterium]|nr:hypothetical protein [Actinomycetota bacterium]
MKKLPFVATTLLLLSVFSAPASKADPNDIFPVGPYKATLISESILYPSLLGVKAGQPVADVSGVLMPDGKLRAYVFGQNKGIEIFESSDGKTFSRLGNAFGGDNGHGQPRVIKLSSGGYRMFNMSGQGLSCSSSTDGLAFSVEAENCIKKSDYGVSTMLSGPGIIKLSSGGYRAYFSSLGAAGTGPDPQQIFSATSPDSLVWTPESGVRVGKGSQLDQSAEHPTAISHSDGSITMFYFDNGSGASKSQGGIMGLYYATSKDGLSFTNPIRIDFTGLAPKFRNATGNDPDIFLDKAGNMILWGGDFDHDIGGYIFAVKLTHTDVAPTPSTPTQVSPPLKQPPVASPPSATPNPMPSVATPPKPIKQITITCVKGKVTKKVTAASPKCPSGYKKK